LDETKKDTNEKKRKNVGKGKRAKGKEVLDQKMEAEGSGEEKQDNKQKRGEESSEESSKSNRSPKKRKTKENVEMYVYDDQQKIKKVTSPTRLLEQPPFLHPNYNSDITKLLQELGEIKKNLGDKYKAQQYFTAVESLTAYPKRVKSGEEALKLDGVGYKISKKIQEILENKKLKELEQVKSDPTVQAINELCQVHGIGGQTARKFVADGIRTIDQLRKEPLNKKQQIGVKYFEDLKLKIPRKEVEKHFNFLKNIILEMDNKMIVECVGSYRREEEECKNVDILMAHPKYLHQDDEHSRKILDNLKEKLIEKKYLVDEIGSGAHQIIGIVKLPREKHFRKFEVKLYPMESFYTGLLHFTGSSEFLRQMRRIAKLKGYKLSEYYLGPRHSLIMNRKNSKDFKVGKPLDIKSEKDIFDALDLPYRYPKERSI
jgi:DNA polymerase beta